MMLHVAMAGCYTQPWLVLQRAIPNGVRVVLVPESGISEKAMDTLGRALGQHPRVLFFAVHICVGDHSKPGVLKDCNAAEARVCGTQTPPERRLCHTLELPMLRPSHSRYTVDGDGLQLCTWYKAASKPQQACADHSARL